MKLKRLVLYSKYYGWVRYLLACSHHMFILCINSYKKHEHKQRIERNCHMQLSVLTVQQ